ncbi:uncharacterized protein DDB_G0284459 [Folsomia candida]|uniref:uncharacterized protein DDB_G0284459 n=1 Tax=Folsomia candida TaxID=158441 RepID=UPI000B902037|nr:uncharacterized protein DDB_G0284459 [Folsomia candida]XP_035704823.1 uncharacterized protein DDB_G0284459 [Folsomia candida]XP_035704824.1 uncharacterized protein DDB_G0284459 [Folsomia candida]XP_035704825.1 uncharacterized protein DDB_G0284459 [Folsomia candida]
MPRIDPERLLKTLAPLLEPASGAIKSNNEVDKIYGLMSKFSKKLVSKCTYINILKATPLEVLDLFLQRGGWDMVLGWTSDATSKKSYDLLKEICGLLLYAPATIQRLKENELPKIVKSISKDCENEEIRELAKQVVLKWIAVAKHLIVGGPTHIIGSNFGTGSTAHTHSVPVQSSSVTSTRSTGHGDHENHTTTATTTTTSTGGDLDISSFDISQAELNAIIEFNPEDFNQVVDQHLDLSEAMASGNAVVHSIDSANVLVDDSADTIKIELNNASQSHTPTLSINTSAGQNVVVRVDASSTPKQEEPPYCIMMKDGKPFLVRLKLAPPKETTGSPNQLRNQQEITSTSTTGDLSPQQKTTEDKQLGPGGTGMLKTYSKRTPVEVIAAIAQPPASEQSSTSKSKSGSKSKSDSKDPSQIKKQRSSSKGSSAAAAAAAKKAADEEKLKEQIRQQKATLKKRSKDAAKQKQQEKDQETLKKLNLNMEPSVTAPPNNSKIPKIPKRQSSFADALGYSGESDKIIKKKTSLDHNSSSEKISNDSSISSKNTTSKPESSINNDANNKGKESRRHRPKVFSSKSSRADDLLKDMTETVKSSSKSNKSESSNKTTESSASSSSLMGEKSSTSISSKPEKRPSIDGIEKPGDSKKPKIDSKPAKEKKPTTLLKESSLFMDALTASSDTTKASNKTRKRRLSSTTNDDKLGKSVINNNSSNKEKAANSSPTLIDPQAPPVVVKPVFNFYRETLEDIDTRTEGNKAASTANLNTSLDGQTMDISGSGDDLQNSEMDDDDDNNDVCIVIPPKLDSIPLKSALVIHRSRNKPKKSVRWRDDDELTDTRTFELDEEERVNVTKHKDFLSAKEHEKAEEKEYIVKNLKQRMLNEDSEEKMPWRKPLLIALSTEEPKIESNQKDIQEERERLNLGVFLPPGSMLPDTASEPDPSSPSEDERIESITIPIEDVMNVTKVYDNRNMPWPKPKPDFSHRIVPKPMLPPNNHHPFGMSASFGDVNFQQQPPPQDPQSVFPTDFGNPWNIGGANPTSLMGANNMNMNEMVRFPPINTMTLPPGFPPPPPIGNPFFPPQQQTRIPFSQQPLNAQFPNVPPSVQMMLNNNIGIGREPLSASDNGHSVQNNTSAGGLIPPRDFDLRRQLSRDNPAARDQDSRSRGGGYDSRGRSSRNDYSSSSSSRGSRDHDRDRDRDHRRSPSPRRRREDRDRERGKDYRDHDYRSRGRSGSKRDIPCRFFMKGHCNSGSRCDYSHELNQPDRSATRSSTNSTMTRSPPPATSNTTTNDSDNWEDNGLFERRRPSADVPSEFTDTPLSPTNDMMPDPSLLPAKIIPVE